MGSEKEVDFQGPEVKGEKNNEDQQYQKNDEDRKYRNGDEPVVERRESSSSEREDKDDITDARKKENLKSDIPEPLPPPVVRDGRRYLSIQRWYHGSLSRAEATRILQREKEGGVFLVRDSTTIKGDFVLCVKEGKRVSHYIINREEQGYRIAAFQVCPPCSGDQTFSDLPALVNFYKVHYLDSVPLVRPIYRSAERYVAKFDFQGNDPDDLPFEAGEELTVVSKDEVQWWTVENYLGQQGLAPVPYLKPAQPKKQHHHHHHHQKKGHHTHNQKHFNHQKNSKTQKPNNLRHSSLKPNSMEKLTP